MRVIFAPRKRSPAPSQVLKQTFPPPVFERIQSRLFRIATAARKRWNAPSNRIQVLAPVPPVPTENYFTRILRTVFAPSRHVPAPSTRWKTFPPPIFERVQSRLMRMVFASRKRAAGKGQVLKQTFPPPVFERIQSRLFRIATAARKRWNAPSSRLVILAPPIIQPDENYFTRVIRRVFGPARHVHAPSTRWKTFPPPILERIQSRLMRISRAARLRWQAPSKKVQALAPPAAPPVPGLIPFLRSFRLQGRDRKRSGRMTTRITFRMFLPPVPIVSGLKRIAGWFRNFWRVG